MEGLHQVRSPEEKYDQCFREYNMTENELLRKLLWMRHGCPFPALYGDDGEMQCSKCGIDFKRASAEYIERRFIEINNPKMIEAFRFFEKQNRGVKT